jgi:hypothetical protein
MAGDWQEVGMARQDEGDALRELEHRLRNELWSLQMRGEAAAEKTAGRQAELKEALAAIKALLAEITRRHRFRSA